MVSDDSLFSPVYARTTHCIQLSCVLLDRVGELAQALRVLASPGGASGRVDDGWSEGKSTWVKRAHVRKQFAHDSLRFH